MKLLNGVPRSVFTCVHRKLRFECLPAYQSHAQRPASCTAWRPSLDDVESISRGGAAKNRGTGSRRVPHRLNSEERGLYDLAKKKVCSEALLRPYLWLRYCFFDAVHYAQEVANYYSTVA